jgi:hypothetical protein
MRRVSAKSRTGAMSGFSNRPVGVKRFQTIHWSVASSQKAKSTSMGGKCVYRI